MITEDYVSFETAKLLKEKGFDWETSASIKVFCGSIYEMNGKLITPKENTIIPTLQMAMKWLRRTHGLFIRITEDMTGNVYEWSVYQKNYGCRASTYVEDSYEQACETAIKYCLENLI